MDDAPEPDRPPGFLPLRLLLQPGGLCVELTRPDMILGRHSSADIRLSLPDVSRRHCRFVCRDGHWEVLDLNSLNGVFVNGQRLQEATLFQGDRIRLGGLTFLVDLPSQAPTLSLPVHGAEGRAGILQSIVDVLPPPEKRKAS